MRVRPLRRREVLVLGAGAGVAAVAGRVPVGWARARTATVERLDFATAGAGEGWPGWRCAGAANLFRADGRGVLEAATDVFPSDPRPVAFAVDRRIRDGSVVATIRATGAGAGVVLRRTGFRSYYAAVVDDERDELVVLRRLSDGATVLGRASLPRLGRPVSLSFRVEGRDPVRLEATVGVSGAGGAVVRATDDDPRALVGAGDPGVLATARTLFEDLVLPGVPALANGRLAPYGTQEGQAFLATPAGRAILDEIRERSTAVFEAVELRSAGRTGVTRPSVVAATSGPPVARGARVRVALDVPARVEIEVARNARFRRSRRVRAGRTDGFDAAIASVNGLRPGGRVFWRARVRRGRRETVGPTRSFRVPPRAGSPARVRVAIGSCAVEFGPVFDRIAEARPDVFVWQGDLNYPDTMGPLAQSVPAYAGIWREFLANPRLAGLLGRTAFAAQRDDHDFGLQDANATNLVPWGLTPWRSLVERRSFFRFSAGLVDVWVLDQRQWKSDPALEDDPEKTLLGRGQRAWLLRTLAASRAPFKVVCSPCTLAPLPANTRDGSWAAGFTAERDLLLEHVRSRVSGRTVFVSGDTHWTMAYERDGLLEVRPCPLGIPTPNDITLTQPQAAEQARAQPGVEYADDERGHVAFVDAFGAGGDARDARLVIRLVREDGAEVWRRELRG